MTRLTVDSPIGPLTLDATDAAITSLDWGSDGEQTTRSNLLSEARAQLDAYFAGRLQAFDLPLAPAGTEFQKSVWREMSEIPYGETRRYGDLARRLDSSARAVGGACGRNPIPVIIPCHRVVAGTGLGGYSGKRSSRDKTLSAPSRRRRHVPSIGPPRRLCCRDRDSPAS